MFPTNFILKCFQKSLLLYAEFTIIPMFSDQLGNFVIIIVLKGDESEQNPVYRLPKITRLKRVLFRSNENNLCFCC